MAGKSEEKSPLLNRTGCLFLCGMILLLAGFFGGWELNKTNQNLSDIRGYCTREKGYQLISPLLGCEVLRDADFPELDPLKKRVGTIINRERESEKILSVSVYFRLLNSARWFAINGDALYSPASLLKIPLTMAYYKIAEEHPEILKKEINYDGGLEQLEFPDLPQKERIQTRRVYTVEELIEIMLKTSSNVAMYLLSNDLKQNNLKKVYEDLDITGPFVVKDDFMSVKSYSFFFRVLYNATYLPREFSEHTLDLLTRTEFNEGLTAKLPANTVVAHKFGARVHENSSPLVGEIHDCGIVYYPAHPYFLCIMTTGYSSDFLKNTIADVSFAVYDALDNFFHK